MAMGGEDFQLLLMVPKWRNWNLYRFSILARSLTFLLSDSEIWQESGSLLLLQLDENNFRAKSCSNDTENCTIVYEEVQFSAFFYVFWSLCNFMKAVDLLANGNAWIHIYLTVAHQANSTIVQLGKLITKTADIWSSNITFR